MILEVFSNINNSLFYIFWLEKSLKACGKILPQADNIFLGFSSQLKQMLGLSHSVWKIITDYIFCIAALNISNLVKEYYCNLFFASFIYTLLGCHSSLMEPTFYILFWSNYPVYKKPYLSHPVKIRTCENWVSHEAFMQYRDCRWQPLITWPHSFLPFCSSWGTE